MPFQFTPWKTLTQDNEVRDVPARGFQYRYNGHITVTFNASDPAADLSILIAAMGGEFFGLPWMVVKSYPLKWHLEFTDADGTVLLEHEVTMTITVVALVIITFGIVGMSFFTWYPSNEQVTEIAPPDVTKFGFGYTVTDNLGDFTDRTAHLWFTWYSPIYMVRLPAGAKVHVTFHNIGVVDLPFLGETMQTRVLKDLGGSAVRSSTEGTTWWADVDSGGHVRIRRGPEKPMAGWESLTAFPGTHYDRPTLLLWPTDVLGVLAQDTVSSTVAYVESLTEGDDWEAVVPGPPEFAMYAACLTEDGGGMLVLGKQSPIPPATTPAAYMAILHGTRSETAGAESIAWSVTPALMADGTPLDVEDSQYPMQESGGILRLWVPSANDAMRVLTSSDDGQTWVET